ncbi:MAG: hypothetical protein RRY34_04955 [Victivallaceae bacterium]
MSRFATGMFGCGADFFSNFFTDIERFRKNYQQTILDNSFIRLILYHTNDILRRMLLYKNEIFGGCQVFEKFLTMRRSIMSCAIKPMNKTFAAGKWMPKDQKILTDWLRKIMEKAEKDTGPLKPVVQDLKNFIENDA